MCHTNDFVIILLDYLALFSSAKTVELIVLKLPIGVWYMCDYDLL